jgi:hypothetical protein
MLLQHGAMLTDFVASRSLFGSPSDTINPYTIPSHRCSGGERPALVTVLAPNTTRVANAERHFMFGVIYKIYHDDHSGLSASAESSILDPVFGSRARKAHSALSVSVDATQRLAPQGSTSQPLFSTSPPGASASHFQTTWASASSAGPLLASSCAQSVQYWMMPCTS